MLVEVKRNEFQILKELEVKPTGYLGPYISSADMEITARRSYR